MKAESHLRNGEGCISRITESILEAKVESDVAIDNYLDHGVYTRVRTSSSSELAHGLESGRMSFIKIHRAIFLSDLRLKWFL